MKLVLKELFLGYSFRSKVENQPQGNLYVVQMKDLQNGYRAIGSDLTKIDGSFLNNKYLLKKGDVLFLAKGAHNYACVYNESFQRAVAASAFFVLRPNRKVVSSDYLAWYINQEPAQRYLQEHKAGTYTLNVNRAVIEELPIEYPSLVMQQSIVQIANLQKRERELMESIGQKRERLVSNQLLSTIKLGRL